MNEKIFTHVIESHIEWSKETFPLATADGALIHASKEIEELRLEIKRASQSNNPDEFKEHQLEELADVFGCMVDAATRLGFNHFDISRAMYLKLQKNKARKWKSNGDGSYSHIK